MNYLEIDTPLAPHHIPDDLRDDLRDERVAILTTSLTYHKGRGLYLSIARGIVGNGSRISLPFSPYNKRALILPMKRKSDKIGNLYAQKVRDNMPEIVGIALASESPDMAAIVAILGEA